MGVCRSNYNKIEQETDKREEDTINSSLSNIRGYKLLFNGYLRKQQHFINLYIPNNIIYLIKKYFLPHYILTAICGARQKQTFSQFKELFNLSYLSYKIKDYNSIRSNHNILWITGAYNVSHYVLNIDTMDLKESALQITFLQPGIVSEGIENNNVWMTWNTELNAKNVDYQTSHHIFYINKNKLTNFDATKHGFESIKNCAFINDKDKIIDIKCGSDHCLFLTQNGVVWSHGPNKFGQIGQTGQGNTYSLAMSKIEYESNQNIPKIKQIVCGSQHNLMIDEVNQLWVFGNSLEGQLGVNEQRIIYKAIYNPYFKENNIKINAISCGMWHSLCVDINGFCYSFGRNRYGEIGNGTLETQIIPFMFNKSDIKFTNTKIVDAKCGEMHCVLLTSNNDIITFGSNFYCECSTIYKKIKCMITGYVVSREKEMGIDEDDRIAKIIVSKTCTIIVIDNTKTRNN